MNIAQFDDYLKHNNYLDNDVNLDDQNNQNNSDNIPTILECVFQNCQEGEWEGFFSLLYNRHEQIRKSQGQKILKKEDFIPIARKCFLVHKNIRSDLYLGLFANEKKTKKQN